MRSIVVIDDALESPDTVYRRAVLQDFKDVEHQGQTYTGIATGVEIWHELEDQIGEAIGGKPVRTEALGRPYSFWRISLEGEDTATWIHSDLRAGKWAAVLYMWREKMHSGTAFWELDGGLRSVTPEQVDSKPGFGELLDERGQSQDGWTMTDYVGGRYNRLAVYRGEQFHSRMPRLGWGDNPRNCRLIWVAFFNREDDA